MKCIIKDGRVIDPANKVDAVLDVLVSNGKIEKVGKGIKEKGARVIEAKDKIVAPGLIDMHVHLREPGREDKETVETGTLAAVGGGITSVCCMPNTEPAIDTPEKVKELNGIIKKTASSNVYIVGAITKEREGGELTDMRMMKRGGICAVSDDGNSVENDNMMLEALTRAGTDNLVLSAHCEDKRISGKGVINEGIVATKLGLRPSPRRAEFETVKRDIELAAKAGAHLHIAHVSCKESIELIRKAKKKRLKVTAEVTPHHFTLTDECCLTYDTNTKVNPPLRSKEDCDAIKKALGDGTIDAVASDHAPHGKHEKDIVFDFAAFGMIGLETSLALTICLVREGIISWKRLVELMSSNPARILALKDKGSLSEGTDADIVIIDPEKEWTYKADSIRSKSKNTPFIDWQFKGKAVCTIVGGKVVMQDEEVPGNKRTGQDSQVCRAGGQVS